MKISGIVKFGRNIISKIKKVEKKAEKEISHLYQVINEEPKIEPLIMQPQLKEDVVEISVKKAKPKKRKGPEIFTHESNPKFNRKIDKLSKILVDNPTEKGINIDGIIVGISKETNEIVFSELKDDYPSVRFNLNTNSFSLYHRIPNKNYKADGSNQLATVGEYIADKEKALEIANTMLLNVIKKVTKYIKKQQQV